MQRTAKRLLRSPKVIVGELLALALICSLGAALPQAGTATPAELARWHDAGPLLTVLKHVLALDHIFRSGWFLAVTALTCASLTVIVVEQTRRCRMQWSQRLSEAYFRNAALQTEWERESVAGMTGPGITAPGSRFYAWTERRIGLLGSPGFHLGLLLIIVAGAGRALFGTQAVVDVIEGETLPPTAAAWTGQWPGALGRAFQLDCPVTLDSVKAVRYQDGDLRELTVRLSFLRSQGHQPAELAVNHDLKTAGGRIFLGSDFGPAVLVEWQSADAVSIREAALLAEATGGSFEGASTGPNNLRAYLRARVDADGAHPDGVEVRVMQDGALLFAGDARPGQTVSLPGREKLVLHGTPFWVRVRGSRDPALPLAYLGFALVMAGAVLIFAVVKLDGCVLVARSGERERVFVALKPQRFAPLFQERLEQLVRECGAGNLPAEPNARQARAKPAAPGLTAPAPRLAGWLFLLVLVFSLTGCHSSSLQQARQLVEQYNQVVSEAYRRGDVRLIDSVVGPNEGKKLTGLIGVRLDLGLTLDSQLLSLEITGTERSRGEWRVTTRERWRYRDRKIGTGQQVGEESLDSYEMLYVFKQTGQAWLVDEIRFLAPPLIGRKETPWLGSRDALHSIAGNTQEQEAKQP